MALAILSLQYGLAFQNSVRLVRTATTPITGRLVWEPNVGLLYAGWFLIFVGIIFLFIGAVVLINGLRTTTRTLSNQTLFIWR